MLKTSESFQEIKNLVDRNVREILQDGQQEFGGKYSEWIQQVFNLQLEKIHSRLKQAYTQRLKETLEEKERRVLEMKSNYRSKLIEFERATKKFQDWYDEVLKENEKQAAVNDKLTADLKEKENQLRRDFNAELESKLIQLESDFQLEKQKDLSRHSDQLKQVAEKGEADKKMLANQFQHQIDTLKAKVDSYMVRTIQSNTQLLIPAMSPNH